MTRTWLTPQAHERLRAELVALMTPHAADGHDEHATLNRHQRELRIRQIQDLLTKAVVGQDPPDDGVAEPGMVLTVRYDDTGETETFLLGARDAEHGEIEVYSPDSPLGTALTGARRGEQRHYPVPSGRTVRVTLLDAVPYTHFLESVEPARP
ncbi:GreA/GreB family elongation factor [Saccharothrix coeruleofusca]|uniref:Transcription elongation factor GreA n=1 Tax=Saccharothrix coeruleofusca TaxID=33919 RepID=A0A918EFM3_9PSEU|nr:GreA/GreB family elongation factor [Saccharothrix coeruleofusca]MBP2335795.1 transcription elongation GreA/GreB family factor [Saccharothrix coeruleofusca]GGP75120.1 transcription elongation factor GreA [Saccharothrix coeruleofusca]